MTMRGKKSDKPEDADIKIDATAKPAEANVPISNETAPTQPGAKPRMVLKTIKRATTTAPLSPTLRRVAPGLMRRVVPKAAPPKPVPPPPPPPPPLEPLKPVEKAPVIVEVKPPVSSPTPTPVTPSVVAAPAVPSVKLPEVAPKPAVKDNFKKEPPRSEPTVTYKLPTPPPPKAVRTPISLKPATTTLAATPPASSFTPSHASKPSESNTAASAAPIKKIRIPEIVTVKDLADRLEVKPFEVIKKLLGLGTLVTINQQIDIDTATLAVDAFGMQAEIVPLIQEDDALQEKEDPALLKPRAPIVTIMGHVDHGKTSLLDTIRKTRVAEKEAGGITQHIGAYRVPTAKGDVVFLDTPGHEAFTAMRARGAQVTDIVVLVVAADDGVMPQTIEAIDHARAAGVTIMVAVNKIDLPTADPEKIRRELTKFQLVPEDWGGKTIFVDVSAKKGTNVDKLLEMLSLESELLELKANPARAALGVVTEARLDARRGVTASLLVQKGTLRVGDVIVAGTTYGRVKALTDDRGERLAQAGPSTPVEVLGLSAAPQAGDRFIVLADEREARTLVERRQNSVNEEAVQRRHVTLETLHARVAEGKIRELKIILKADVQGSVQAIRDAIDRLSSDQIRLNVIHSAVGGINETDVTLADASDAIIIGFNVRPDAKAEEIARREKVDVKTYRIIYEAIADVRAAMEGLLEPETVEVRLGRAEVRQVFKVSKVGVVAGSMVLEGKLARGNKARLIRDNVVVFVSTISSLHRFKDEAKEVDKGFECGIGLANFQDMKSKDIIEAFSEETKARKLVAPQ